MDEVQTPAAITKALTLIGDAANHKDLARRFIAVTTLDRKPVEFGVRNVHGVNQQKARIAANKSAVALLETLNIGDELTDEQRATLAAYSGEGGLKGDAGNDSDGSGKQFEYYTPEHVAQGMWDLLAAYGADTGNGLEPSAGTGIFNETKPASAVMTAAELSHTSAKINQLLHPEDKVHAGEFERLAVKTPDDSFDFAIGNVPFGEPRVTADLDPDYAGEKNLGRYFVHRMIDKTKPNGLICVVIPEGMTSGSKYKKFRAEISRKAEFLGAHRLPSSTFGDTNTATVTDVWVLKKHPAEAVDRIANASDTVLTEANILWPTFITGKWFEKDGKRFVHGEAERTSFNNTLVVKDNGITKAQIKQQLARRFDSRIDWDVLQFLPETAPHAYAEGERRIINNRWHTFILGRWEPEQLDLTQDFDADTYGASNHADLREKMSTHAGTLSLSLNQIKKIAEDMPHLVDDSTREALQFIEQNKLKPQEKERVFRGWMLGQAVNHLADTIKVSGEEYAADLRTSLQGLIADEVQRYGVARNDKRLSKLSGKGSGQWLRFLNATDADGKLSAFLQGSVDVKSADKVDTSSVDDVLRLLFSRSINGSIPLSAFRDMFAGELPADSAAALAILAQHPSIAITADGELVPFDRATSGNIASAKARLLSALEPTPPDAIKANYMRQLEAIESKRPRTKPDDITFSMGSRWFDRSLVLEFLQSEGYDKMRYIKSEVVEDGQLVSEAYQGKDGLFAGYTRGTVQDKKLGVPTYKQLKGKDEQFERQFENYLNGIKPRGVYAQEYANRIREMEERFDAFVRQHDDFDSLVDDYNDTFNYYIPYEHSDADLGLENISGDRVPFNYQNSAIRRLSEDGRGILGFGTGMGKTTTALALEAYNFEQGRSKRTCIVVPKAVYENWYHEARQFYNDAAFENMLFVGLDVVKNDAGEIERVAVLDEEGNPTSAMRDNVKLSDSATISARMHSVPQSNWRSVVMTKEQFAALPLREETIEDRKDKAMDGAILSGKINLEKADSHREATKRANIKAKAADTGTAKKRDFPYFEDMEFDSVIVDEGHNYRNSYGLGRESAGLAYLPSVAVSQQARDMAVKNQYLMDKYNGRGTVMLTATPAVNSPVDAYNMLSHVMTQEEWAAMGIYNTDDFVRVFGDVQEVFRQTLSGDVVRQDGLVGFKNLDGLRSIFHRWVNLKNAQDVGKEVKIPDLVEETIETPMSDEQTEIYDNLRKRAAWSSMSKQERALASGLGAVPPVDKDGNEIEDDQVFSIIRDMDRVCSDLDLYYRRMTFRVPVEFADQVQQAADALPTSITTEVENADGELETVTVDANTTVSTTPNYVELVVHESFESKVVDELKKLKVTGVTHPVTPKFAAMLANLKKHFEKGGKQIVFSDEKSQHGKLVRLISTHLDIEEDKIGIINATSVAERGKAKKMKKPKDPGADASPEELAAYAEAMDAYELATGTSSLAGLEGIAADYNEGRTRIVICNKKAEVGINLHKGTTAIHHITLPWTPASIAQRNGRGARVGAKQDKVDVYYYCGKGSFDEFRLNTLKHKGDWIKSLFTSEEARMANADAGDSNEMGMLLAENEDERRQKAEEAKRRIEAEIKAKAAKSASINLQRYMKAISDQSGNLDLLAEDKARHEKVITGNRNLQDKLRDDIQSNTKTIDRYQAYLDDPNKEESRSTLSYYRATIARSQKENVQYNRALLECGKKIADASKSINAINRKMARRDKADSEIARLKPTIASAIKHGLLDVDDSILTEPQSFAMIGTTPVKIGAYFEEVYTHKLNKTKSESGLLTVKVVGFDPDKGTVQLMAIHSPASMSNVKEGMTYDVLATEFDSRFTPVSYTESDVSLLRRLDKAQCAAELIRDIGIERVVSLFNAGRISISPRQFIMTDTSGNLCVEYVREGSESELRRIVVPSPDDKAMLRSIAMFAVDMSESSYSTPSRHLELIFGASWKVMLRAHLDAASPEAITEYAAKVLAAAEQASTTAMLQESAVGAIYDGENISLRQWLTNHKTVRSELSKKPSAVKNATEFDRAAERVINEYADRVLAQVNAQLEENAQRRIDEFRALIAAPDAQISDRASELAQITNKYNPPSDYYEATYQIIKSWRSESQPVSGIHYPRAFADLVHLGYLSESSVLLHTMKTLAESWAVLSFAIREMKATKTEEQAQAVAEVEEVAILPEPPVLSDNAGELDVKTAAAALGLKAQINPRAINAKYVKAAAGSVWALHDPKGTAGILTANKEELKSKFRASWCNDYNAEKFGLGENMGSWLIPVQHIDKALALLTN